MSRFTSLNNLALVSTSRMNRAGRFCSWQHYPYPLVIYLVEQLELIQQVIFFNSFEKIIDEYYEL